MIKFKLNRSEITNSFQNLIVNDYTVSTVDIGHYGTNKLLIVCQCDDVSFLNVGDEIQVITTIIETEKEISDIYTISNVNYDAKTFSFFDEEFVVCEVENIISLRDNTSKTDDYKENENIRIDFVNEHFFIPSENGEVYISFNDKLYHPQMMHYHNDYSLLCSFGDLDQELYEHLFGVDESVGRQSKVDLYANKNDIKVLIPNFKFRDKADNSFYYKKDTFSLKVPLVSSFETNLQQESLIQDKLVKVEKNKLIGKVTDMEKDVYYPSKYTFYENIEEYRYEGEVSKIKFNLHFREHRGKNWIADNKSYWNGVFKDNGLLKVNEKITKDDASDLLGFLGFNNQDVFYQKNVIKKSFLRLSYFDSPDSTNQNLLAYSTIFLDSNSLFSKYVRFNEKNGYREINLNGDKFGSYYIIDDKVGIKVNREMNFNEDERLSSQIVVKDKNISNSSSEGFYLYLWKDYESPIFQDIYMKVEFNHAGFGRSIPFMLPYFESIRDNVGRVKTFSEIVHEHNQGGYGMKEYLKYSYIKLKCFYDKEKMCHVYFLDPYYYGNLSNNNKEIVLNLYEAKISK